jgi:hypothetical protein
VVVGVELHRGEVADDRRRVRGLDHLTGVARVEERVVVRHALGEGGERGRERGVVDQL